MKKFKLKKINNKKKTFLYIFMIVVIYAIVMALTSAGVINRYYNGILITVCINLILVVSLNLTTGYLGQLTLGHAGFMAIGAYAAAYFSKTFMTIPQPFSFIIALLIGGVMAMIAGLIIGVPALRLKGDYLAIITLGFGEVIKTILLSMAIIGGAKGYIGIPRVTTFTSAYVFVIITIVFVCLLIKSRHGRAIISISEDEIASEASGINIVKYKIMAFAFAAFFAGIAGGIYAHYMGIIEPKTFGFNKSIEILVMVVLGGMGSINGAVIATIAITILPEMLRSLSQYRTLMYAVTLIGVMLHKYDPRVQVIMCKTKVCCAKNWAKINPFKRKEAK